jgi:hypothetical protein
MAALWPAALAAMVTMLRCCYRSGRRIESNAFATPEGAPVFCMRRDPEIEPA